MVLIHPGLYYVKAVTRLDNHTLNVTNNITSNSTPTQNNLSINLEARLHLGQSERRLQPGLR